MYTAARAFHPRAKFHPRAAKDEVTAVAMVRRHTTLPLAACMLVVWMVSFKRGVFRWVVGNWLGADLNPETDEAIATLQSRCGELCDTDQPMVGGPFFNHRKVPMNCIDLFSDSVFTIAGHGQSKAPETIPSKWRYAFTLGGKVPVTPYYFNRPYLGTTANVAEWTQLLIDTQAAEAERGELRGTYSVDETNALRDGLQHAPGVQGGRVLVIGSERPWVEACVLAAGASSVVTLEYGQINCTHPRVSTMTPVDFKDAFEDGSLGQFDAVVTFSSVEHSGLGRYGDALNPWGDILEIARAWCVTKPGGSLTIGVMYGPDRIFFNAHRVYGPERWPYLTTNWEQHYLGRGEQKVHVFVKPADQPRFLQYVCDGDCGGWGDRWKGAVAVYALARESNRTFRMLWKNQRGAATLAAVFQDHAFFAAPPGPCKSINWMDTRVQDFSLDEIRGSTALCISVRINIYPTDLSRDYAYAYDGTAKELWRHLHLLPKLQQAIDHAPARLRCAQLRLGVSANFPDVVSFVSAGEIEGKYSAIIAWFGGSVHNHLWTDSDEHERRWRNSMRQSAVAVAGPLVHIAKNPSKLGLQRTVIEWSLISKCHEIVHQTGYIRSGLFLAEPGAHLFGEIPQ
jgi:hypothetical protein